MWYTSFELILFAFLDGLELSGTDTILKAAVTILVTNRSVCHIIQFCLGEESIVML